MSIFTSLVTQILDVPNEPGQKITIRRLAPKHLKAAQKASLLESIAQLKEIGGPAFLKEMETLGGEKKVAEEVKKDPLLKYDRIALIERGVVGWTYSEERTTANFEEIDDDTAEWLAREILRLSKPSEFQTDEEQETERGNASAPSTATLSA